MRAVFYEANGPARDVLRIGEMPTPDPGPGEVRVRLRTSGVNPSDVKSRGHRKSAFPRVIPHSDGAGQIEAVGAGVPQSRIGERVWIWNGQWQRPFGTAAEQIALPARQAVRLPDDIGFAEGATLGIPALTGFHAVELARAENGATVLVSGGAGCVSQYAIQFAKARGASVVTTISSPDKAVAAREAGADHCIDYRREDVGARVAEITAGHGVDAIIEMNLAANAGLISATLRPKGRVIVYGTDAEATIPAFACLVNSVTLRFFLIYQLDAEQRDRAIAGVTRALEQGWLVSRIGPSFPLAETAAAHEAVEQGTIGNVVVTIP
ncbi:NADPH:quinone oxidoreductase [Bosea sp. 62]|uniref:NADPH:quinone reductase n=1 Tax=unclassified Bosea (in: a-proteobacteria) TaxID=2653178 RepID=UPI0012567F61|nr:MULTISPECIES: NADPH:quinone reductase [unclassified Bosea (in: a-proteobacteria)]CAD5286686.1 NADPH:quinone oxidoreductase [Bosea sp. 21B]CAD5289215.1 NADPH:quinone oxidoreductase [Bosea sp. 46]CAD5301224.1 NADPH:quinone oxidoreductase [Bosea sp. 7B]VVT60540.1 NADPH:quinone oxidoreductase [Bosea sp. EC-HK365B]VXB04086.1 NADPH:quinone oxidoreductase [Bosea sp. 62]